MKRGPILFLWIILSLGMGACTQRAFSSGDLGASPSPEHNLTPTETLIKPTHTGTPLPSPTPSPTQPSPSATPIPTLTPTSLACWSQGGRMESASLRTNLLPLPLDYLVHLPPCYDQQPGRRYPVLYLIHGQNYNNDQWDRLGADETADSLVAAGEIPPFIIVLPRDRSWAQPTEDMFGQAIIQYLIPAIDKTYRTLPQRAYRSIGGLSRGAGWAVHLGLTHWELFGSIGAHSLPVFWTDTAHIRDWLDAIPPGSMPRIYMDTGDKDYLIKSTLWFEQILSEKDIPHTWYLFIGYHEEAYWRAHVAQYLRWYAKGWENTLAGDK